MSHKLTLEGIKIALEKLKNMDWTPSPTIHLMHPKRYAIYKENLAKGMSQMDALIDAESRE